MLPDWNNWANDLAVILNWGIYWIGIGVVCAFFVGLFMAVVFGAYKLSARQGIIKSETKNIDKAWERFNNGRI